MEKKKSALTAAVIFGWVGGDTGFLPERTRG